MSISQQPIDAFVDVDSDAELEAALPVVDEPSTEAGPPNRVTPSFSAGPLTTSLSPFKLPPDPSIPQDISIIMEMVGANEVVGSLPPLAMTAAEKRKLVEESLKSKGKGKEKEVGQQGGGHSVKEEEIEDTDSDSSSEFESSEDEEKPVKDEPMTEQKHEQLKQELNKFLEPGLSTAPQLDVQKISDHSDSDSDSDSEDEGVASFPGVSGMGFEFIDDSDGEIDLDGDEGGGGGGPITSTHEMSSAPVQQPPFAKLPDGEKLSLAGDVVSWMKEKKVEVWWEKKHADEVAKETSNDSVGAPKAKAKAGSISSETSKSLTTDDDPLHPEKTAVTPEVGATPSELIVSPSKDKQRRASISTRPPTFSTSGTVVVRAMQSRPGAADEGWLEEGSVLCWEDGRVLGIVHETFGPLTSPFYTIRLPPPPFPYPEHTSLTAGTRLYYPLNASYRSFVNMLAVRDPRFKGSDASNLYDEEIGEDEMEWSDDEAEAEAKKRRKTRKSRTPSVAGTPRKALPHHSLPERPHFDYHPDDVSETGSLYGGDEWEGVSDAASTASGRARAKPAPYDVDEPSGGQASASNASGDRGARGGAHGRGQGRERGRGRGRGGRGGGGQRGRGNGQGHHQQQRPNFHHPQIPAQHSPNDQYQISNQQDHQAQQHQQRQSPYLQQSWSPQQQSQPYPHQPPQPTWQPQQPQQFGQFSSPFPFAQPGYQQPFPQPHGAPGFGLPPFASPSYNLPQQHVEQGYDPSNPSAPAMGAITQQNGSNAPAINPRFAAQYQQMLNEQGGMSGWSQQ